ncbi:MAG: XdhC family protein, partial [Stackebrandtia sp.]
AGRVQSRADGGSSSNHAEGRALAGTVSGSLGEAATDTAAVERARELLASGRFGHFTLGERDVLVESYPSPPRLLVFGAVDFAAAVVRAGKFLGYRVTVCDARAVFATNRRFPEADEVIVDWPHRYLDESSTDERTAVCVLTHDPKFDIPLLERALRLPLGYVGAMGSRRTHRDRVRRLRDAGLTETELARLHSPIGLDLGGRGPEETALSIAAEIVARRHGAHGGFLSATDDPIHRQPAIP